MTVPDGKTIWFRNKRYRSGDELPSDYKEVKIEPQKTGGTGFIDDARKPK